MHQKGGGGGGGGDVDLIISQRPYCALKHWKQSYYSHQIEGLWCLMPLSPN